MNGAPSRALPLALQLGAAADAVDAVLQGRSLTESLARVPAELRPAAQALAFHTMRRLGSARAAREVLAPRRPPAPVESLLLVALALLWPQDEPAYAPHTLVDQSVACMRQRSAAHAGFVNAVLRRFLRDGPGLVTRLRAKPEVQWEHPAWWIERLRHDWPDDWQHLLQASNEPAPMVLRVNVRHTDAAGYVARLAGQGIDAWSVGPQAVRLATPAPVQQLPGFSDGWVSVQDAHAQLAAPLLLDGGQPLRAGARVLDACAAPGGKTAHLLERAELDVLAIDVDEGRLRRVHDTLDRLRLHAELRAADAAQPADWWDGRPFDAILLDAPCSASGIVRRHPDVRWLRRPTDIATLASTQSRLLDALWPLLAPGGRLLYATCSLFRAEGEEPVQAFLARQPQARSLPAPGHLPVRTAIRGTAVADNPAGSPSVVSTEGDGFFYALLEKVA